MGLLEKEANEARHEVADIFVFYVADGLAWTTVFDVSAVAVAHSFAARIIEVAIEADDLLSALTSKA